MDSPRLRSLAEVLVLSRATFLETRTVIAISFHGRPVAAAPQRCQGRGAGSTLYYPAAPSPWSSRWAGANLEGVAVDEGFGTLDPPAAANWRERRRSRGRHCRRVPVRCCLGVPTLLVRTRETTVGFRFRRTFEIAPGVRLNVGPCGASVTVGRRGTHVNAGLPDIGVSCRTRIDGSELRRLPGR